MRQFVWALSALILGLLPTRGNSSAQDFPPDAATFLSSDGLALHQLFGSQPLASNTARIGEQVRRQPAESQFQLLLDWVLPNDTHPDIRLTEELFQLQEGFTPAEGALLMQKAGTSTWTVSNLTVQPGVQGDFDSEVKEIATSCASYHPRTGRSIASRNE